METLSPKILEEGLERGNTAFTYINGDYLQTYLGVILRLRGKVDPKTIEVDTFSECYPNMTFGDHSFSVNAREQEIITELDRLATEAKRLLKEPTFDRAAFVNVVKQAALACRRPDFAEGLDSTSL